MGQEQSNTEWMEDPTSQKYQDVTINWTLWKEGNDQGEDAEEVIPAAHDHLGVGSIQQRVKGCWERARVMPYSVKDRDKDKDNSSDYLGAILEEIERQGCYAVAGTSSTSSSTSIDLTGTPKYNCYVNRQLPGRVIRHPWDSHPTNAVVWELDPTKADTNSRQEVARTVVGDSVTQNTPVLESSTADNHDPKRYQIVTTKAGSRLWSISLVGPTMAANNNNNKPTMPRTHEDLKASFPGQLLVRIDEGRQMLMYDAFEYTGEPAMEVLEAEYKATGRLPCTEDELTAVEYMLHRARRSECPILPKEHMLHPLSRANGVNTMQERLEHIGFGIFVPLLEAVRFKRSRIFRVRFPMSAIVGARLLVALDANGDRRPQAKTAPLPESKEGLDLSNLGEYGPDANEEDDTPWLCALPGTFQAGDDTIENLGVLVLELASPGAGILDTASFSSTIVWPVNHADRKRVPLTEDWTPHQAFSKATRHYMVGDMSEMKELAEFLVHTNPQMKILLAPHLVVTPPPGASDIADAPSNKKQRMGDENSLLDTLTAANTLSGPLSMIQLNQARTMQSLASQAAFRILKESGHLAKNNDNANADPRSIFPDTKAVDKFLQRFCDNYNSINPCFKAGLLSGNLEVPDEFLDGSAEKSSFLAHVFCKLECPICKEFLPVSIEMAIARQEGGSYWDSRGTVSCANCANDDDGVGEWVITDLCCQKKGPSLDCGKFHRHCTRCPDFGKCIGDSRTAHCHRCGDHYFSGNSGLPCHCQATGDPASGGFGYEQMNGDNNDEESIGSGVGDYFKERNDDGELTHFYDAPVVDAWSGLFLPEPYVPPPPPTTAVKPAAEL